MGNTKIIPRGFGPALSLVLLAGVVGGFGQWWADGASGTVQLARCGALLAEAWEAALVEEVLFRGALLWACLSWAIRCNKRHLKRAAGADCATDHRIAPASTCFAIVVSSLVFGLMHLLPNGSLIASGADTVVVIAQAILKVAQSTLFGAVMALLVVRSPYGMRPFPRRVLSLVAPVIVHGIFDLLFWGPLLLTGGALPSTYLTGNAAELLPLVATTILLAGAAKCSFRH